MRLACFVIGLCSELRCTRSYLANNSLHKGYICAKDWQRIPSPLTIEPLPSHLVSYQNQHYTGNIDRPNLWVFSTDSFQTVFVPYQHCFRNKTWLSPFKYHYSKSISLHLCIRNTYRTTIKTIVMQASEYHTLLWDLNITFVCYSDPLSFIQIVFENQKNVQMVLFQSFMMHTNYWQVANAYFVRSTNIT